MWVFILIFQGRLIITNHKHYHFHVKIGLRVREQFCGPYWTVHMAGDFISNFQFLHLVFMDPEYTLQHWR